MIVAASRKAGEWYARAKNVLLMAGYNVAVLGTILLCFFNRYNLWERLFYFVGTGVGVTLALVLLDVANQNIAMSRVPRIFRGLPIPAAVYRNTQSGILWADRPSDHPSDSPSQGVSKMFRKQRKVKRYHNIYRGSVTSSPFFKLGASAAALAVLIAAGWFLYEPVYQFVMGIGQEKEPVSTAEQPSEPESESDGFLSGLFGGGEESETETSQSQPEAVEAVQLHGVYMPESILLDSTQRSQFIQTCASNGINAIFFDLKNDKGYLTYQSSLAQARSWVPSPPRRWISAR